jgi:hypothetical protein
MVQEEKSGEFHTSVIYHSMPISVVRNPIYRQEFMLKFGPHVQHILDCPETSRPENGRMKAMMHTHRVKQICPLIIPVTDDEIADYNAKTREAVDLELMEASNQKLRHAHAKLGLAWEMFPRAKAKFDETGVFEMT